MLLSERNEEVKALEAKCIDIVEEIKVNLREFTAIMAEREVITARDNENGNFTEVDNAKEMVLQNAFIDIKDGISGIESALKMNGEIMKLALDKAKVKGIGIRG